MWLCVARKVDTFMVTKLYYNFIVLGFFETLGNDRQNFAGSAFSFRDEPLFVAYSQNIHDPKKETGNTSLTIPLLSP